MTLDAREFRDALSAFATGVTIVTAKNADGDSIGMTASSFNSVSMDPPLILWSVTKSANSAPAFKDAQHFAVHVLASDQIQTSNRFAKSGTDKFGLTDHSLDSNHVPILPNCASRFDCKQFAVHDGGDHWIIIGEVIDLSHSKREGLVFSGGSYATASLIQPSRATVAEQTVDAPIESVLFYQLSRAYHQISSQFHSKIREAGLTLPEWRILACLSGENVKRTVSDLSKRTFIQPVALVDMLDTLETRGLCSQHGTAHNAVVSGTEKGHEKIAHLFELDSQLEQGIFGGIKTSEAKKLFALLREVIEQTN